MQNVQWLASVWVVCTGLTAAGAEPKFTMDMALRGQRIEGTPLVWSNSRVFLLGRDGRLWDFPPGEAEDFRKTATDFRSYPANVLKARLEKELGPQFEVTGTGHFLVAHPRGQGRQWAQRFEDMYRSFVMYFSVRGFKLQQPEFPLMAIVFPTRQQFLRYSASDGSTLGGDVLGYYSNKSNRVALYDVSGGKSSATDWRQNADTVLHEAAHQAAFNTGIHSRFAPTPRWVVEGLGTLFEARGVYNSRSYTAQKDRINGGRLADFNGYAKARRKPTALADLVASDRLFDKDARAAYAEAWALTFFLVETMPREYARYLSKTANRPAFSHYTDKQRLDDFTAVFGKNLPLLEARFGRFINDLR